MPRVQSRAKRRRAKKDIYSTTRAAALASTLALATLWREAAAAGPPSCSLDAGCSAGFYAGARHLVARGGGCGAAVVLARRGLQRWLLRWRAPPCGARRRLRGRRRARSTRAAALASTLARATLWREAAAAGPPPCSPDAARSCPPSSASFIYCSYWNGGQSRSSAPASSRGAEAPREGALGKPVGKPLVVSAALWPACTLHLA